MKFNPAEKLVAPNGVEIRENGEPISFGQAIASALLDERDANLTGDDKVRHWLLAKRLCLAADAVDLSIEEAAQIKAAVAKRYAAVVSAPIWIALEAAASAGS